MKRKPLTEEQRTFVRTNYTLMTYKEIAEQIGVNWEWLRHHAVTILGLKRGKGRRLWTAPEKGILVANYSTLTRLELSSLLPGRTWQSCHHMAQRLGLKHPLTTEYASQLTPLAITPTEAAYIAGIVDGEGSVFILKVGPPSKRYLVSGMMACNTDRKMIEFVRRICGGSITERQPSPRNRLNSTMYVVNIRGVRLLRTLQAIKPYMITKQRAAMKVEEYLLLRLSKEKNAPIGGEEYSLYEEWRKLCPRKGSPEWTSRYST